MPFSVSGLPTTLPNELNFWDSPNARYVTSWFQRFNDVFILGNTLSTKDHTSGSVYNKIFTPSGYIGGQLRAADGSETPIPTDYVIIGITASPFNGLSLGGQEMRGYTLFVKYGYDNDSTNFVPNDNIREKVYNPGSYTGYVGITKAGSTFYCLRNFSISLGLKDFGPPGSVGLTGCYTYYLYNAHPNNYGEMIWRVQFSFGGTSGTAYDGPVVIWDGISAYQDITKPTGPSYWLNNDGCAAGITWDDGTAKGTNISHAKSDNPASSAEGINDPYPHPIDYVQ
jgi:hypothetical protein